MVGWVLEYVDTDRYDVVRDGRRLQKGLSADMALRYLRKKRKSHEKAVVEEKDGYHVPLSTLR
jgi:hypothetical protein